MRRSLLLAFALAAVPVFAQRIPADLDDYVRKAMKVFEVPGVAVAVVKDGEVVAARGYGVRKTGAKEPVDEHTLFGIASNTKAFTSAALAMLAGEGKLTWDDPATRHLPAFQMYDPYVTREMTIRDLLTHRSGLGLGAGDLLFFPPSSYTGPEIVARLRFIKPASSFRSRYAYDNLLYVAAGQVVAAASGEPWDEFIRKRIFGPVGMTDSNTSVSEFRDGVNFATPHSLVEGKLEAISPNHVDNVAPAAAINASVADMAKWMIVQLDGGRLSRNPERRLFSARDGKEMWSAQTILPVSDPAPWLAALQTNFAAYGLGWGLREYRGHKQVSHTGGLPGYVSQVMLVPDLNLGIVVLTNQEAGEVFSAITYHVIDGYLGAPPTDWIKGFQESTRQRQASALSAENKAAAGRAKDSHPSLPLEKYAGRFTDAWYGEIGIAEDRGRLVMRFSHTPSLVGDLEHWQYDTFKVRWRDRSLAADAFVTFSLKPDGTIREACMVPVSTLTDFSYDFQDLLLTPAK